MKLDSNSTNGHRKLLAICTPGGSFSAQWREAWDRLLLHVASRYRLMLVYSYSNNIYVTRESCYHTIMAHPEREVPDYVLWIDSDNPPNVEGFDCLMATLDECPDVGAVAGWYRYRRPDTNFTGVAAGWDDGTIKGQVTEEQVLDAKAKGELLGPLSYSGFGFLLQRGSTLLQLGAQAFRPYVIPNAEGVGYRVLNDDPSYFRCFREAGFTLYLHPLVFVEHEKTMNVPAAPPRADAALPAGNFTQQKGEPVWQSQQPQ